MSRSAKGSRHIPSPAKSSPTAAFTLIELSIVLVIIGLIIGGILVGQDLIAAASVRAQVAQIEKYNSAVNTFRNKYNGIPGDIAASQAAQFGFVARSGINGDGDGNGELDGVSGATAYAWNENGENLYFWEDLSSAGFIDQQFTAYTDANNYHCSGTTCNNYFPSAKIGGGNMLYTYSGYAAGCCAGNTGIGPNFFGMSVISSITAGNGGNLGSAGGSISSVGLTVMQAAGIDKKVDDGVPTAGNILAQYLNPTNGTPAWSANAGSDSATTCFNSSTKIYSTGQNGGTGINCSLSFKMQGAAR